MEKGKKAKKQYKRVGHGKEDMEKGTRDKKRNKEYGKWANEMGARSHGMSCDI